jgi:hypothetical protein
MNNVKANKYKKVYREQVLPKKTAVKPTVETCKNTIQIYEEFVEYRKRANYVVFGGDKNGDH